MDDEDKNVLPFPALVERDERPTEVELAGWRENARRDPDWAARQIWGLLRRAIDAESIVEDFRSGLRS